MTLDARLHALKPGQQIILSHGHGFRVIAERQGNGRRVRMVRESANDFQVLRDWAA